MISRLRNMGSIIHTAAFLASLFLLSRGTCQITSQESENPTTTTIIDVTTTTTNCTTTTSSTSMSVTLSSASGSSPEGNAGGLETMSHPIIYTTETVLPGAAPITIDGTPVSLDSSGNVVVGTSTIFWPSGNISSEIITIQNQVVPVQSTGFEVPVTQVNTMAQGSSSSLIGSTSNSMVPTASSEATTSTTTSLAGSTSSSTVPAASSEANSTTPTLTGSTSSSTVPATSSEAISTTLTLTGSTSSSTVPAASSEVNSTAPSITSISAAQSTDSPLPSTLLPGDPPITFGGVPVSLGQGGTLLIGGSTDVIPPGTSEVLTVGNETVTASAGGVGYEPMEVTSILAQPTGLTTITGGLTPMVFSSSFISVSNLTTWSQTTTSLSNQGSSTVLPVWPCMLNCGSDFDGVIIIPIPPYPSSDVILPPPFTFPALSIGLDGQPTPATATFPTASPQSSITPPTAAATTTTNPTGISLGVTASSSGSDTITSTMTTVPPGFSIEAVTESSWTANTWITTEQDGTSTVVPVLVGCPGCGGQHGGIVLWGLPPIPHLSFQFPKFQFPTLPSFHLPCIKILGIHVAGDCNKPPSTDGDNQSTSSQGPGDETTNPTPTQSTRDSTTETTSTSQASSSQSSCSTSTVSSCGVTTICPASAGGTTTLCTTISTCSPTATGCDLPSATIDANATPYVIYAIIGASSYQTNGILALLNSFLPENPGAIFTATDIDLGILFWKAPLTPEQVEQISGTTGVSVTTPDNPNNIYDPTIEARFDRNRKISSDRDQIYNTSELMTRDDGIVRQLNAFGEMTFFNIDGAHDLTDQSLTAYSNSFYFDNSAGEGVPVYIVDSGANLQSLEFTSGANVASKVRWMFATSDTTESDSRAPTYHGTCMLGKIAGDQTGIAKKVSPILSKVGSINGPADWLYALSLVSRDLGQDPGLNNPSPTRCVVLLPFQFPSDDTSAFPQSQVFQAWSGFFSRIMVAIDRKGCLLVTGSGNNNFKTITNLWPVAYAPAMVPNLLVAGACNQDGTPWQNTWGTKGTNTDTSRKLPTIWAPGFTDMSCATGLAGQDPPFRASDGGTSEAAASVAGLAAYFLGLTSLANQVNTPANLKAFIETSAILRGPAGKQLPCAYNRILFSQVQANPQCPVVARDGILSDGCAALSSNIPSSPSNSLLNSITPSVPTTFSTVTSSNQSAITTSASSAISSLGSSSGSSLSLPASSSVSSPASPLTTMQTVTASVSLPDCSNTATQVPGQCGSPGCAYILVADGGSDLCSTDYCNCGGIAAPLITSTINGSVAQNCAYSTLPTSNNCPSNSIGPTLTSSATFTRVVVGSPCTYVILGHVDGGLCADNYCDCGGGLIAQPNPTTISNSTTQNCEFSTRPPSWSCSTLIPTWTSTVFVAASPTPTGPHCITCPGGAEASSDAAAKCPPNMHSWAVVDGDCNCCS